MPAACLTVGLLKSGRAQERQAAIGGGGAEVLQQRVQEQRYVPYALL